MKLQRRKGDPFSATRPFVIFPESRMFKTSGVLLCHLLASSPIVLRVSPSFWATYHHVQRLRARSPNTSSCYSIRPPHACRVYRASILESLGARTRRSVKNLVNLENSSLELEGFRHMHAHSVKDIKDSTESPVPFVLHLLLAELS